MMKHGILSVAFVLLLTGCTRYSPAPLPDAAAPDTKESLVAMERTGEEGSSDKSGSAKEGEDTFPAASIKIQQRKPEKVKGIYLSAYTAGNPERMEEILQKIDETEINAVVIDVKDDEGRVTFAMDSPVVTEIGACQRYIRDIDSLVATLKEHNIYLIARVVAFRDPYLAENKPEWSLKRADGTIYRDKDNLAWVDPYQIGVWDYLMEIGSKAKEAGFDEIQFDYIRFSTGSSMKDVVFTEEVTKGRSRTDIISEFTSYAYGKLAPQGLFVSADVFGAIIGSDGDADTVGQIYGEMASNLDYICPMIYPSHYGDGNFGLEHPDLQPYETITAALAGSKKDLAQYMLSTASDAVSVKKDSQAVVRPWLQDFTASYLKNHVKYGPDQVRAQIQGVYDSGYEEWILWNSSNRYSWDGLEPEYEGGN